MRLSATTGRRLPVSGPPVDGLETGQNGRFLDRVVTDVVETGEVVHAGHHLVRDIMVVEQGVALQGFAKLGEDVISVDAVEAPPMMMAAAQPLEQVEAVEEQEELPVEEVSEIEPVEDEVIEDKNGVGTTFRCVTEERGRRMVFQGVVTLWEPPTKSAISSASFTSIPPSLFVST